MPGALSRVSNWFQLFLALLFVILPIWLAPELPTADGPAHVYNSYLACQTRAGIEPFASYYRLRTMPRSNFATDTAFRFLGPMVGWQRAERVWFTWITLLCATTWFFTIRQAAGVPLAAATAGWFANNWFLWMGFYDFSLSLAFFLAFSNVVHRWGSRGFWRNVVLLLLLLYAAHLFTFAMATALLGFLIGWRVLRKESRPWLLAVCVPFTLLIALELALGSGGQGEISWTSGWHGVFKAAAGWIIGDAFLSFSWSGLAAGLSVMVFVWMGLAQRCRVRPGEGNWGGIEVFLLISVLGSCVAPDVIGSGSYTSARWRIGAVLLALPLTATAFESLRRRRWFPLLSPVLLGLLCIQSAAVIRESLAVAAKAEAVYQALAAAKPPKGAWVMALPSVDPRLTLRIPPFMKVLERAALRLELNNAQNYEPSQGNFEVRWRAIPPRLRFDARAAGFLVTRMDAINAEFPPVWVLHEADVTLFSGTPDLLIGQRVRTGALAVTRISFGGN